MSTVYPTIADSAKYDYSRSQKILSNAVLPPLFRYPPVHLGLFGDIVEGYNITQVLPINLEKEDDGSYVVSDDIFLVYGSGDSRKEAINDYVSSLIEFYEMVEEDASTNDFDKKLFMHLRSYLAKDSHRGYEDAIQA
jgi:hypothetical protein